jgi:peptide/nickel transport system substrate-binding protein
LYVLGLGAAGSLLAACQPSSTPSGGAVSPKAGEGAPARPADAPTRGGVVNIGTDRGGDADVIGTGRQYQRAIYNTLVRADDKGNLLPELAESWEITDPKTYVFKLRKGVKFHDGTDFDAEAVAFNFKRVADPANKSLFVSDWAGIDAYDVVDASTLRIRLKEPDVTLLGRLSGKSSSIASPTAIQRWGADYGQHPVGTGPFKFGDLVMDSKLTLTRFDQYWEKDESGQPLPYLDSVVFKTYADATARVNALRGGEIEYMDEVLPRDALSLKSSPEYGVFQGPGTSRWFWLNGGKAPFESTALRQAIAYAVDRDALHKAVWVETGSPGRYMYSPENAFYDQKAPFYTVDPAKVKAKLAEGGAPNGFKFTAHIANVTIDQQIGQALKGQLAEHGIDMMIEILQTQTLANQRRASGDFEASLSQFSPYPDPNDTLFAYLRSGRPSNYVKYSNPRVDELLDKAKAELNLESRKQMYAEIQKQVIEDSPIVFLHHDAKLVGLRSSVQGYRATADTWMGFQERLWIKK